jgi:NADH:ubiquinone oxidoreductase subunit 6 (subunit J)
MMSAILFYAISSLILFTAVKMIFSTNLVHSALFMASTFIGIAFVYLMLEADYLAVVQILVYVGAISILFVFGVMLTKRNNMEESSVFNRYRIAAGVVAASLMLVLGRTIYITSFNISITSQTGPTISAISALLLNDYAIPFELAGISLLVAMIGAIIIGGGVKNPK